MAELPETRASLILRLGDAGDAAAWDEFAALYAPLVYRLARSRGLQAADADDLAQEVLAAVSRSVQAWIDSPDRGPFRAWLFCIARNTAINFLTRARHRPLGVGGSGMEAAIAAALDRGPELEAEAFEREYRREVLRWAAGRVEPQVTERTWRAFWGTAVEGKSVAEMAAELGMTEGSVYIARSRVMARLRECVRRRDEESGS